MRAAPPIQASLESTQKPYAPKPYFARKTNPPSLSRHKHWPTRGDEPKSVATIPPQLTQGSQCQGRLQDTAPRVPTDSQLVFAAPVRLPW
eukprot:2074962-Pyramimonas_sp.AAC.3